MGWIKLHRGLKDWEWYDDANAVRLLIHLLITVNYKEKKWHGIIIKPGSRITSWETLSNETGLTVQQVRTAMIKLVDSKEITRKITNKFQLVTLVKWEELQQFIIEDNRQTNSQVTDKQQTDNKQVTTTKEELRSVIKEIEGFSALFKEKWIEWLDYKKQSFNFTYKTRGSEEAAIKKITSLGGGEKNWIEIIDTSMANNWKQFWRPDEKEVLTKAEQAIKWHNQ